MTKTQQHSEGNYRRIFADEYHGLEPFTSRIARELKDYGFEVVKSNRSFTSEQLKKYDLYVVWFPRYFGHDLAQFTDDDLSALYDYLNRGGAAFLIGLGWAWTDHEKRPIEQYPLNNITDEHGIYFTETMIHSVAGVHFKKSDVTFFKPFMADHPITTGVEKIGSHDSAPGTLIVEAPAVPLVWGSNQTKDADGVVNPVILASTNVGRGKIVCLQHRGYVNYEGYDNFKLLKNILDWLADRSDPNTSPVSRSVQGSDHGHSAGAENLVSERETFGKSKFRILLLNVLTDRFDVEELKNLCFYLNVDYDNLPAEGKNNKARELVQYLENRQRLSELKELIREQRPDIVLEET